MMRACEVWLRRLFNFPPSLCAHPVQAMPDVCPDFLPELIVKFRLSPQVQDWIWKEPPDGLGLDCLEDIAGAATNEDEWTGLVKKAAAVHIVDKVRAASRLKLMWKSVRKAEAVAEETRSGDSVTDYDAFLPAPELNGVGRQGLCAAPHYISAGCRPGGHGGIAPGQRTHS